jgi:hypothetical protein
MKAMKPAAARAKARAQKLLQQACLIGHLS